MLYCSIFDSVLQALWTAQWDCSSLLNLAFISLNFLGTDSCPFFRYAYNLDSKRYEILPLVSTQSFYASWIIHYTFAGCNFLMRHCIKSSDDFFTICCSVVLPKPRYSVLEEWYLCCVIIVVHTKSCTVQLVFAMSLQLASWAPRPSAGLIMNVLIGKFIFIGVSATSLNSITHSISVAVLQASSPVEGIRLSCNIPGSSSAKCRL